MYRDEERAASVSTSMAACRRARRRRAAARRRGAGALLVDYSESSRVGNRPLTFGTKSLCGLHCQSPMYRYTDIGHQLTGK